MCALRESPSSVTNFARALSSCFLHLAVEQLHLHLDPRLVGEHGAVRGGALLPLLARVVRDRRRQRRRVHLLDDRRVHHAARNGEWTTDFEDLGRGLILVILEPDGGGARELRVGVMPRRLGAAARHVREHVDRVLLHGVCDELDLGHLVAEVAAEEAEHVHLLPNLGDDDVHVVHRGVEALAARRQLHVVVLKRPKSGRRDRKDNGGDTETDGGGQTTDTDGDAEEDEEDGAAAEEELDPEPAPEIFKGHEWYFPLTYAVREISSTLSSVATWATSLRDKASAHRCGRGRVATA